MKLLKTHCRSTMTDDRLNALAMLYVHSEVHPSSEEVLKRFIAHDPDRLKFNLFCLLFNQRNLLLIDGK